MRKRCEWCGRAEAETVAETKTLGLYEELQSGVYSCCQIATWADEQWLAWSEATSKDASSRDRSNHDTHVELEAELVPVRVRRPVPWFRGDRSKGSYERE